MLLNGEIEVATSARKTRERTEIYLYFTPISLNNTVLTVRKGNTSIVSDDYSTYDGMVVGLLAGNSQNRFLPDLYNKYYGTEVSVINDFTQREQDYIEVVALGDKRITATAMADLKPYSYVEDGELKGILPQFFDYLMQMAGLPYEVIVPADRAEYDRLRENGGVDVVIDWHQTASVERDYADPWRVLDKRANEIKLKNDPED